MAVTTDATPPVAEAPAKSEPKPESPTPVIAAATSTSPGLSGEGTETPAAPVASTPTPEVSVPAASTPPPASTEAAAPTTAVAEPTPTPAQPRDMVADARLVVLRAMFPDFDDSLLQSVLDSVNGNSDRAIDALLGMSDPDFQSDQPQQPQQQVPQTQEELDEQLARTLMLEDQRQEHAWRAQQAPARPEPRRRGSEPGAPEKDTMQEFQEQFNKFAETGKKTFGTLFSKVKAKIQEFDQPAAGQSSAEAPRGSGGDTYPYEANQNPYPARTTAAQQQRQQEQAQMPAYYDPNAPSQTTPPSSATAAGYDVEPASMTVPSSPPKTNTGAPPIDGGKLGMLPKRPVSLLRTQSPPSGPHSGAPPSSDDELEYAENPFEERKK